jgi:hypothetical protein
MANLFKPKYKDGHLINIKPKTQRGLLDKLKTYGLDPLKVLSLIKRPLPQSTKYTILPMGSGNQVLNAKLENGAKIFSFRGAKTTIENLFDHYGKNTGKSATDKKTKTKELVSLCLLENKLKTGKLVDEDFVDDCLPSELKTYYNSLYYDSAEKQVKAFLNKVSGFKGANYDFELQAANRTKRMYEMAQKLSGLQKDNWNPADMWIIKKNFDMSKLEKAINIDDLNSQLIKEYKNKNLLGISLKQVTGSTSNVSFVNEKPGALPEVNIDFSFDNMALSETFNNAIIETKGKFAVRIGYKAAADNFNVYLEGRMIGSNVNMGAVDAKKFPQEVSNRLGYTIRKEGEPDIKKDFAVAKKEYKEMYGLYKSSELSNKITSFNDLMDKYEKAPAFVKKRFIKLITFVYPFMVLAKQQKKFKDFMKWNYFTAKKITSKGGFYMLLS